MSKNTSILKKAYCPKCKATNELYPIFDVNPEADVCYCPNCMREFKPKEVIDNYNYFIAQKINKAESLLFTNTEFSEAYDSFGRILKIDPTIYRARFGRILSLIYMSNLRKTSFLNAGLLLKEESETYFRKLKDFISYMKFLTKVNYALDEYYKRFTRRITHRDRFYNQECIELYALRLCEIKALKNIVLQEAEALFVKFDDPRVKLLIASINVSVLEMDEKLSDRIATVDGRQFKFEKCINDRQVVLSELTDRVLPSKHYVAHKLHEEERKGRLIKNKVYPDNSHLNSLIKGDIPLIVIFSLLTSAAIGAGIFFRNADFSKWLYLGSIGGGLALIICLTCLIAWKIQLGRRRHLID